MVPAEPLPSPPVAAAPAPALEVAAVPLPAPAQSATPAPRSAPSRPRPALIPRPRVLAPPQPLALAPKAPPEEPSPALLARVARLKPEHDWLFEPTDRQNVRALRTIEPLALPHAAWLPSLEPTPTAPIWIDDAPASRIESYRWLPAAPRNFSSGRQGMPIRFVVIHTMEGTYEGTLARFRDGHMQAASHYCIRSYDGQVTQMVADQDNAWHTGNWYYNLLSIGIEHEGYFAEPERFFTEAMYRSSARLVRSLCLKHGIPMDRDHILGHYQVPVRTERVPCAVDSNSCGGLGHHADPGPRGTGWDWERYLRYVNEPDEEPAVWATDKQRLENNGPSLLELDDALA